MFVLCLARRRSRLRSGVKGERTGALISRMLFLFSPLIPLCGLESAHARQRSSKLDVALAYSQISHFSFLKEGVILAESLHALLEHGIEFVTHAAGASTYAWLERTCGVEVDAGYAVSYEFLCEFAARESGV